MKYVERFLFLIFLIFLIFLSSSHLLALYLSMFKSMYYILFHLYISLSCIFTCLSSCICACLCVYLINVPSPDCCLRTCLIYLLILARGGTFFLEQPASSLMRHYFRFQFLAERTKASGHGVSLQVRSTRLYIYI